MLEALKCFVLKLLLSVGWDRTATRWWISWHDDGSCLSNHWAVALGEALQKTGQTGRAADLLRLHWKKDGDPLVALSLYRCVVHAGHLAEGATLLRHALERPMGPVLRLQVLGAYCTNLRGQGAYIGAVGDTKELYELAERLRHNAYKTAALVILSVAALKKGDPQWRWYFHELNRRPYASLAHTYYASEWSVLQSATEDR